MVRYIYAMQAIVGLMVVLFAFSIHSAHAAPSCLEGDEHGWCRVADPIVRHKSALLSADPSIGVVGGRQTRYLVAVGFDQTRHQVDLAFEDVGDFQTFRYNLPQSATGIAAVAHDDGTQTALLIFLNNVQGDGFPNSLDVLDTGWRYYGK